MVLPKAKSTNARKNDIPNIFLAGYRAFCKNNKHKYSLGRSTKAKKAVIVLERQKDGKPK